MTKKEQAEMERLRTELAHAVALRWSGYIEPKLMAVPTAGYVNGWIFNIYDHRIMMAWSEQSSHGLGVHRTGGRYNSESDAWMSASQKGMPLFESRRDALVALRIATEREYAKRLAAIDAQIEQEASQ